MDMTNKLHYRRSPGSRHKKTSSGPLSGCSWQVSGCLWLRRWPQIAFWSTENGGFRFCKWPASKWEVYRHIHSFSRIQSVRLLLGSLWLFWLLLEYSVFILWRILPTISVIFVSSWRGIRISSSGDIFRSGSDGILCRELTGYSDIQIKEVPPIKMMCGKPANGEMMIWAESGRAGLGRTGLEAYRQYRCQKTFSNFKESKNIEKQRRNAFRPIRADLGRTGLEKSIGNIGVKTLFSISRDLKTSRNGENLQ